MVTGKWVSRIYKFSTAKESSLACQEQEAVTMNVENKSAKSFTGGRNVQAIPRGNSSVVRRRRKMIGVTGNFLWRRVRRRPGRRRARNSTDSSPESLPHSAPHCSVACSWLQPRRRKFHRPRRDEYEHNLVRWPLSGCDSRLGFLEAIRFELEVKGDRACRLLAAPRF